jgi:hypothetical protein
MMGALRWASFLYTREKFNGGKREEKKTKKTSH